MKTRIVLAASLALTAMLAACNSNKSTTAASNETAIKASGAAMNANCPFSNNPANASITRSYKGQNVGFCCNGCSGKWDKMSDADRDAKLATMKK